tara:strand:- start:677 stop:1030 length:354 start_codon:yes stop_codon:yes gene_type:complete
MSNLFINVSIFDNDLDEFTDFDHDSDNDSDYDSDNDSDYDSDDSYDKENIYEPPLFEYRFASLNNLPCYSSHTYTFIYHMQTKPYYEKYKQIMRYKNLFSDSNFQPLTRRESFYEKS